MTIKIKNVNGKEFFSFEAKYITASTIADLFGLDSWEVHPTVSVSDFRDEPCVNLCWHVRRKDNKTVVFSYDSDRLDVYMVHLFEGTSSVEPDSWEQVMDWGR